jgi:TfoX/Sxy family transcriptional regulator of competence genes
MEWKKSPPELIARFDALLPADPRVERRKMFGYPAGFVNGRLFAGLHGADLVLKLPEEAGARLQAAGLARPFEPASGRRMGGFVAMAGDTWPDSAVVEACLWRALAHVSTLPAKAAKRRARA